MPDHNDRIGGNVGGAEPPVALDPAFAPEAPANGAAGRNLGLRPAPDAAPPAPLAPPRFTALRLSLSALRARLRPKKHESRQAMRDSMLAETRDTDIRSSLDRLSQAMGHEDTRRKWRDGVGFRGLLPEWYRNAQIDDSLGQSARAIAMKGHGLDQTGKSALVDNRSTLQRLALHRDRRDLSARFEAAAQRVNRLEKDLESRMADGGVGAREARAALFRAQRDMAGLAENLLDVVELERGRLADIRDLDKGFDDGGFGPALDDLHARLAPQVQFLKTGIGGQDPAPDGAALLTTAGALKETMGVPGEPDALRDLSSPTAMRAAAAKGSDPQALRRRRVQAKTELTLAHARAARPQTVLDERLDYDRGLYGSLKSKGMAAEFEHAALNAKRDAFQTLKQAMAASGSAPFIEDAVMDGMSALEHATDRLTFHRRRAALQARKQAIRTQTATLRQEIADLGRRAADPAERDPAALRRALQNRQWALAGLSRDTEALNLEFRELAQSDLTRSVRRRYPADIRNPPSLDALEQAVSDAHDAVRRDIRRGAAAAPIAADGAAVNRANDAFAALVDSAVTDIARGDGSALGVSAAEIDHVMASWGAEVAQEKAAREAATRTPPSFGRQLWQGIARGLRHALGFGVLSKDAGVDEIKGLTKLGAGATEATIKFYDARAEALEKAADAAEHALEEQVAEAGGGAEARIEVLKSSVETMEKALNAIELAEHVVGAGSALINIRRAQKKIDFKKGLEAKGDALVHGFKADAAAIDDPARKARFEARNAVKLHLGHKLAEQEYGVERAEQVIMGGQATRHIVQNVGRGITQYGPHAAAQLGATVGVAGLGGAIVFEGGETVLAAIEAHKGRMEVRELEEQIAKDADRIIAQHRALIGDVKPTLGALAAKLAEIDKADLPLQQQQVADFRKAVQGLADLQAFVDTLKARKNVDEKIIVAARSGLATGAYAGAFAVSVSALAGATGGIGLVAAPIAMGVAGGAVLGVHAYRHVKHKRRVRQGVEAQQALMGRASGQTVAAIRKEAKVRGVSPEVVAWERLTASDPTRRAELLHDDLMAETAGIRLSDDQIEARRALGAEIAQLTRNWEQATRQVKQRRSDANMIVSRSNAGADIGKDGLKRLREAEAAYDAARIEADLLFDLIKSRRDDLAALDAPRIGVFTPGHRNYSKTAAQLVNLLGLSQDAVLSMIDAGAHENDPEALKLGQDLIRAHLAEEGGPIAFRSAAAQGADALDAV